MGELSQREVYEVRLLEAFYSIGKKFPSSGCENIGEEAALAVVRALNLVVRDEVARESIEKFGARPKRK